MMAKQKIRFDNDGMEQVKLSETEYDQYSFMICNFAEADLSNIKFTDCEFVNCNFALTKLTNTALRECIFVDCKFSGIHFDSCKDLLFEVSFTNCHLNLCSFYKKPLKGTLFKNTKLIETDFAECDLSKSIFDNCDLSGATFGQTNLEAADLRTAYNYSIDPEANRIKKAKFSSASVAGLLNKYDIEIE